MRRPNPRRPDPQLAVMALLATVVLSALGCGASDPTREADTSSAETTVPEVTGVIRGGELVVGLAAESNDWSPVVGQWASSGGIVARAIYDPLAVVDGDGRVQPYLAESFEPNDDFTEWTITVRPGVEFHDGSPLDAAALARNFEERRSGPLTASAYVTIDAVEPVGERAVRVSMSRPWSTFPLSMSGQGGYIAAPATFDDPEGGSRPIGTGPFVFVSWEPDRQLVVERNVDYWQTAADGEPLPLLDGVTFRVLTDPTSRAQALRAGDVDVAELDDADQVAAFFNSAPDEQVRVWVDEAMSSGIVVLNTAAPPFDDPIAREAVAYAIDTELIAEVLNHGLAPAADGPVEPGSLGVLPPEETGYPTHDLARAQQRAAEYEQVNGTPLAFTYLSLGAPRNMALATILGDSMAEAGIQMEIEVVEQVAAIGQVLTGGYQASYFAVRSVPTLDVAYAFYASEPQPIGEFSLNVPRVDSPELRAALDAARATDDPDAQAEAYREAQIAIADTLGWLSVERDVRGLAAGTDVRGIDAAVVPGTEVDASLFATLPFLTSVWLEADG